MPYTDNDTLIEHIAETEIIELCDDEKTALGATTVAAAVILNTEIQDRINRAISNADAKINAFLRRQFAIPIRIDTGLASTAANTPDLVRMMSALLTICFLYQRRRGDFTELPQIVKDSKESVKDMLSMINKGTIDIGTDPLPAKSSLVVSDAYGEDRLFTCDTLEGF